MNKKFHVRLVSDLSHKNISPDFIRKVFAVMNDTPHIYQALTKRADILLKYHKELRWTHSIRIGVSVENEKVRNRIDEFKKHNTHCSCFITICQ
ncbi:MAG: DUF5131 family protein [Terrimonas sp.]|nr:DUF5131 family protein [Terrimonas sp.]